MSPTFSADAAGAALQLAALTAAKATLLLAAAALAALALRRAPAAGRHLLWSLALFAVLALPALTVAVPDWKPGFLAVVPASSASADAPAKAAEGIARFASNGPVAVSPGAPAGDGRLATALLAAWALGAVVVLARLGMGIAGARRLAREARPLEGEWTEAVARLGAAVGVRRRVRLLESPRAAMPVTWGLFRPVVLLPAGAAGWDAERRRVVLLHELSHVARYDCLTQALATVACAVYWFHPGAWWAARQMRVEREQACDDRVLAAGERASAYAGHLLEVARTFRAGGPAAAAAMARPSHLEERLRAVLDAGRDRRGVPARTGAVCAAAALVALLPLAAVSPSEREPQPRSAGDRPAARKKVSLVVPISSRADAAGVSRGTAVVDTTVNDVDVHLDVRFHVQVAQAPAAAAPPSAASPWRHNPADARVFQASYEEEEAADFSALRPRAVAELIRASRDRSSLVRRTAVRTLGELDHHSVVEPIIASLSDADPRVRSEAVRALGSLAARQQLSESGPTAAQLAAAEEAACLENKRAPARSVRQGATDGLRMAARNADPRVRESAAQALGGLAAAAADAESEDADRAALPTPRPQTVYGAGGGAVTDFDQMGRASRWSPRP